MHADYFLKMSFEITIGLLYMKVLITTDAKYLLSLRVCLGRLYVSWHIQPYPLCVILFMIN